MRVPSLFASVLAMFLAQVGSAEAHSKSFFVFGVHVPLFYPPPVYYHPYPPPVVYYPPRVVYTADCRPVTGRGETTGAIYEGIACRQPDGSWHVTPR